MQAADAFLFPSNRFEYFCESSSSKPRGFSPSPSKGAKRPRPGLGGSGRDAEEEDEDATTSSSRTLPARKIYQHPSFAHADQMRRWIREEAIGPILFDQKGVDPSTMQLASWRRIISQAGVVESMSNSDRRKIWKFMRDPRNDITSRHLFLSCGMTAGQICCFYEISKSLFNTTIRETVEAAAAAAGSEGPTVPANS